jgi:alpha-1,6-mannosyltransferase
MAALAVMFVAYVFAVRHAERVPPKAVLMCVAALMALVLLAPPLLSTDVFSYGAYGRMGALYGANPYLHGPYAISLDPLYPFIGAKWVNTPSVYGPLFTALSYIFAPLSIAASVLTYKAIAAVSALVVVACVWHSARWRGVNPVKAVALVGLNPLFVLYGVGGAHNDLLMLAASTAGMWAILQRRNRTGGGLLAAATWIKLTGGLLVPFALLGSDKPMRRSREIAVGAGAVTAVVAIASFALFSTGPLHLPATIAQSQAAGDWHSIPGFLASGLGLVTIGHVVGIVLAVAFLLVCLWLLRGAGWATLAMLITTSSLLPWYVGWLLPLAAISADQRLRRSAVIATGVMLAIQLVGFIPHVTTSM